MLSRRALLAAAATGLLAACTQQRTDRSLGSAAAPVGGATPSPGRSRALPDRAAAVPQPRGPAPEVDHGPRDRPQVALTFHGAGDPSLAVAVLDTAEQAGVHLTVLAVGSWLAAHPQLAARVLRGGHELGNHTMTHPVLRRLDASAISAEITRCRDLLRRLTGSPGGHFRPSGGAGSTALIRAEAGRAGYPLLLGFDVDPRDYADPGADAVARRVLTGVSPGSIVSLHLGHPGTLAALPRVLSGLSDRGLTPVTATRLLAPGRTS